MFTIGNYEITKPVLEIIYDIKRELYSGKLAQIIDRGDEIQCTCPHHSNGKDVNLTNGMMLHQKNKKSIKKYKKKVLNLL